jgi:hypothetical protein
VASRCATAGLRGAPISQGRLGLGCLLLREARGRAETSVQIKVQIATTAVFHPALTWSATPNPKTITDENTRTVFDAISLSHRHLLTIPLRRRSSAGLIGGAFMSLRS